MEDHIILVWGGIFAFNGNGGGVGFVLLAKYGYGVKIGKDAQGRWTFTTSREREQGQRTLEREQGQRTMEN